MMRSLRLAWVTLGCLGLAALLWGCADSDDAAKPAKREPSAAGADGQPGPSSGAGDTFDQAGSGSQAGSGGQAGSGSSGVQPWVLDGTLVAWSQDQADVMLGANRITGDVSIHGGLDLSALSSLEHIDGRLQIVSNPTLTNLDMLARLQSITGELDITDNDALTDIQGLRHVTTLSGTLSFAENDALLDLQGLSGLSDALGTLSVRSNGAMTSLVGLTNLTSVGTLEIRSNPALPGLAGLEALREADGVWIQDNGALANLDGLSNLEQANNLLLQSNDALVNVDGLGALKGSLGAAGIYVTILSNAAMGRFRLNSLLSAESISVSDTELTSLELSSLESVNTLAIDHNAALVGLNLGSLKSVGTLSLGDNGLTNLDGIAKLQTTHDIDLSYNPSLANVEGLAQLTKVDGTFEIINDPKLTSLTLSGLSEAGRLMLERNDALTTLSLPSLKRVGTLSFFMHPALTDLNGLSSLQTISDSLSIEQSAVLTSLCGLSALESIGHLGLVVGNPMLPQSQVDWLKSVALGTSTGGCP